MATVTSVFAKKPLFMQAAGGDTAIPYDAQAMRRLLAAIWPRTGVLTNDAFRISQRAAGANFSVDVAPGFALLGDTSSGESERYLLFQEAVVNVPLTGFVTNPAGTRTHKVFLSVLDKQKTALGTQYDGKIVITEDVGAGAPDPSEAGTAISLLLATFTIAPAAASVANAAITNSVRHAGYGPSYTDIPITTNIASAEATTDVDTPRAIRVGTSVRLSGGFVRTSGNPFDMDADYILGNLPTAYRPATDRFLVAPMSSAGPSHSTYRLTIRPGGNVEAHIPEDFAPTWVGLDGCSYELD